MEYELDLSEQGVSLNGMLNTVGIVSAEEYANNQTRRLLFSPKFLREWAEAVEDATDGREVEVVFTPGRPMVAVSTGSDTDIGIGVCPRMSREEYEEIKEDDDGD